jgi:hypothetical protein
MIKALKDAILFFMLLAVYWHGLLIEIVELGKDFIAIAKESRRCKEGALLHHGGHRFFEGTSTKLQRKCVGAPRKSLLILLAKSYLRRTSCPEIKESRPNF